MSDSVLHLPTAFIHDPAASTRREVWFKMECHQPIGSFKIRGIGLLCQRLAMSGATQLVSSSGGNAGLAVAYCARKLNLRACIVVPSTTPEATRAMLKAHGADVRVHGAVWDEADVLARSLAHEQGSAYIPPFDHPVLWEGHATLIEEMASTGPQPEKIVVAVGGGGLFCGVVQGLQRVGWQDTEVIAVETDGAQSLHLSIRAGRLITLPAITSIAKSLGARTVAAQALAYCQSHPVRSVVVCDEAALRACRQFAQSHRALVEPACGAAVSIVYDDHEVLASARRIAVIACGGVSIGPVMEMIARR